MKTIILLLSLSLLIANCKSEEGASSLASTSSGKLSGDFIPNDINELGPRAQAILNEYTSMMDRFSAKFEDGSKMYEDNQLLGALRAYVNSHLETTDPLEVCDELVDIYSEFGVASESVEFSGSPYAFIGGADYCIVDISLPNGNVAFDPVLNRAFIDLDANGGQPLSVDELIGYANNNNLEDVTVYPAGYNRALGDWDVPSAGTFHESYEAQGYDQNENIQDMYDFYHSMLTNLVE